MASGVSEPRAVCPAGTPKVLLESELGVTPRLQHFLPLPTHLPTVLHYVELSPPLPALDIPMHLVMILGDWSSLSCSLVMRDLTQPDIAFEFRAVEMSPLPHPLGPWTLPPTVTRPYQSL